MSQLTESETDWRSDFPIFKQKVTYLDSAATSQKPLAVIKTLESFYNTTNANIHRGVYQWSAKATELYENSRKLIAKFLNARPWETIFVRNATEGINLVARSWGANLKKGDLIVATVMEHHSNMVPWQELAKRTGATLEYITVTAEGTLDMNSVKELLAKKPKMLAIAQVSNVLGTINPVQEIIKMAHEAGSLVLVDACQSVPHMTVDVRQLDCDFLVFSGHKAFGPTGIGVLYGKETLLRGMEPFLTGGDMIKEVKLEGAKWNDLPWKFEAGTPAIAEAIALGTAIEYLSDKIDAVKNHDEELLAYAMEELQKVPGIMIYGPTNPIDRCGAISFNLADIHAHDLASVLDDNNVAIRSGHHCSMPMMDILKVPATARMSIALYNTKEDVDALITALHEARKVFRL